MERTITHDLTTGIHTQRVFLDGGVFGPIGELRLEDTGTEIGDVSDRQYHIRADDPLSARATMEQGSVFRRGDWSVTIRTRAEQTASKTHFHLTARIECWSGDTLVHSDETSRSIPRNGM